MFKAKQTKKAPLQQFVNFQLSTLQAIKVKGGSDGDSIIIEDEIID